MSRLSRGPLHGVLAILVASVSACDGVSIFDLWDRPPIARTAYAVAEPGSTMPLRLHNASRHYWDYGECPYQIDRLVEDTWTMVFDAAAKICILSGYSLRAGQKITWPVELPETEGTYRIRFDFLHFPNNVAEHVWVVSNTFTVRATPLPD